MNALLSCTIVHCTISPSTDLYDAGNMYHDNMIIGQVSF